MKKPSMIFLVLGALFTALGIAIAACKTSRAGYESARYEVITKEGKFEIRDYPTISVVSSDAAKERREMDRSFMRLFGYITGDNQGGEKIPMTTPVFVDNEGGERMHFVLPEDLVNNGAPEPSGQRVSLNELPGGRFAVLLFRGRNRGGMPEAPLAELRGILEERGLQSNGEPMFAYYDPPWIPGPLRRNEVLLPIPRKAGE